MLLVGWSMTASAQGTYVQLENETELSLSIYQECEEAVSRAKRWLAHQPRYESLQPGETSVTKVQLQANAIMLYLEALAREQEPIPVEAAWLTHVEALSTLVCSDPSPYAERFHQFQKMLRGNAFSQLTVNPMEVALFLMYVNHLSQADYQALKLPYTWREQCALKLVTSQQFHASGGCWKHLEVQPCEHPLLLNLSMQQQAQDETLWALMALRELMSDPPQVTLLPKSAL